ncbi:MAG TPA: hypothetical protein VFK39_07900 [Gemmatimonadaceae bacterium]|nr:hypothetical protein [Gemmatimonadaceae bacterium]
MRFRTFAAAATAIATAAACSDSPPTAASKLPTDVQAAIASGYQPLIISPAVDTVAVGKSITLEVEIPGKVGDTTTITSDDVAVYWGSDDPAIASVGGGTITGRKPGEISVVALTANAVGLATVVVVEALKGDENPSEPDSSATDEPSPDSSVTGTPTPDSTTTDSSSTGTPIPPPSESELGGLASGYSTSSPHWSHIRTLATDFYYHWTPDQRAWAGAHFDAALSGNTEAWFAANPTVTQLPYTLFWTVLTPGNDSRPYLSSTYYDDMKQWYAAHGEYRLEDAFLHTSTSKSEATRVTARIWDSYRWMINPSDPGARAYTVDRYRRLVEGTNGVFIDEASSGDILPRVRDAVEFSEARYQADYTSLLAEIKRVYGSKTIMLNTAEYTKDFDRANAIAAGAVHLEKFNNPLKTQMNRRWEWVEELRANGVAVDLVNPYSAAWADEHSYEYPKGNYATSGDRMTMWELASYYMVVGQNPDGLYFHLLAPDWNTPLSDYWLPAIEANIGHPTGARDDSRQGTDPTGQPYTIYSRDFERALVLIRAQRGWGAQNYKDATAVEVDLPSGDTWFPLNADGTLGTAVTKVKLRNSEALILIKKSKL